MKKLQYILLAVGLWMAGVTCVMAQVPAANIRYVKTEAAGGAYTNDGRSWATAKNNIQDAINALVAAKALPGEVWVGAGTYKPTESTESSGGSTLYMSFKIPAGITVRGGFPADGKIKCMSGANFGRDSLDAYITSPDQRPMVDYTQVGDFALFQTILSGDLTSQTASFVYNDARDQFTTTFYGNSYHVVTFATNGFHPDGHAKALDTSKGEAALDNVIIEHGNAHFTATEGHPHEAYGGGIYMVKGSHVYNTCVRQCEATRAGGGIYMDGGGMADHVYVSECQALGMGTTYGFGGGICMEDGTYESSDPTKGMYPTVLRRSGVTGSVARNGGGLAVYCNNTAYKNRLAISSLLVANNVAQNEAGGVYMYQGGAASQMTVVNNKCLGSGISVNGMVNGRSGGIYVRDFANIANTVVWGNTCNNRNVQYAGSRSGNEEEKKPIVRCSMLSRSDYADWSGVVKYSVNDLSEQNTGSSHVNYPAFENPTTTAGYISDIYYRSLMSMKDPKTQAILPAYSWKVKYASAMANAGVQTIDLDTLGVTPALNESQDIMGQVYSSHPTLGAYTSTTPVAEPWRDAANKTMHLFVDPDANYTNDANNIGNSWDNASHSMGDILHLMQMTLDAMNAAYQAHVADPSKPDPFVAYNLEKLQIHVKEGVITNNGTYVTGHVRNNTLLIPSIPQEILGKVTIEILGGYAPSLTDRDISDRNPMKYPTVITGDILGNYAYNTAHLVTFDGARDVTFDGFQLRNGNATSTKQGNENRNGAAFTIHNSRNIKIKNCLVAHCSAEVGAAVYAENSVVAFENCIFHNNTVTEQIGIAGNTPAVIYSGGTGTLTFDHCDVLRNVGYASWLTGTATQQWTNSIFYGNLNQAVDDTNDNVEDGPHYVMALPAFGGTLTGVSGSYCLFDKKSKASMDAKFTEGSRFDMSYVFDGGANSCYPRMINPTKNSGISPNGDVTYYGRATSFEPHNTNPMVNAATTGGVAHTSATTSNCWGTDMSAVVNRDFGGMPDIGAVENHVAQKLTDGENAYTDGQGYFGRTLYVRDYRDGSGNIDYAAGGDGYSWQTAINGNAYYHEGSGKFLGSSRTGTASWTSIENTYTNNYSTLAPYVKANIASTIQNPKLVVIYNTTAQKYLRIENNTFGLTADPDQATQFVVTTNGAIYDYSGGKYVNVVNTTDFTTSATSRNWTLATNGKIYYSANKKNYYWRVANASATAPILTTDNTNNIWNFRVVTKVKNGTREVIHTDEDVKGINGLQYAVNKASYWFDLDNIRREVWVGAGVYSKDNETEKTGYFDIDVQTTTDPKDGSSMANAIAGTADESCFVIRDGVDVYGAFPKVGNPGKDQRQALVSQYVTTSGGYDYRDYETILEPATSLSTTSMNNTRRVLGQPHLCHTQKGSITYTGATWDGFTLRNGYLNARRVTNARAWGAGGAAIYKNVTLRNCVVTRCVNYAPNGLAANGEFRGGGVYVRGGSVEQCYIINNEMRGTSSATGLERAKKSVAYGAGIYIFDGTVFNCVIANNYNYSAYADGAGAFIDGQVRFFNNTVVNNKSEYTTRGVGGICFWSDAVSQVQVFNTISYNNEGYTAKTSPANGAGGNANVAFQDGGNVDIYNSIVPDMTDVTNGTKSYLHYHDCQVINDAYYQNNLFAATPGSFVSFGIDFTGGAPASINLRLKAGSKAINMGQVNPDINGVVYNLEDYTDMDYTERVKDCSIDVGAYEYNDAYAISPDLTTVDGQAVYYVTPKGLGLASATDPGNAACAEKLQKVLDAAGRYKYMNPGKQVIVKVATEESSKSSATPFQYYATRSTDAENQDVRIWSIMVPRGVEVWGGYTDAYTSPTEHGFLTRDVIGNPTNFDATYTNKSEHTTATTYHTVTFTDRIFDGNGNPYLAGDNDLTHDGSFVIGASYDNEASFKHMTDASGYNEADRAVLDGIFLTGGRADAPASTSATAQRDAQTIHQFGGAAVVEPYAHVRNCIVENNEATYGGAFALKEKALVSGCLIRNNKASKGAGIYVFEHGTQLVESAHFGVYTVNTDKGGASRMDANMSRVILSTIVHNGDDATNQGGGIWFTNNDANVRINSTVLWRNTALDQANVAGAYSPEKPASDKSSTIEFYPFAYSAVQNLRLSGTNNIELNVANKNGARFAQNENDNQMASDETNFTDFGYYGLTGLSAMVRNGMSISEFDDMCSQYRISATDFMALDRKVNDANSPARSYVEIGARAINKPFVNKQIMLRLYVAQPEDIDADVAQAMASMGAEASPNSPEEYYSQEGSSFAYPFQNLQDALDYIYLMRSTKEYKGGVSYIDTYHANDLPFEIMIAKGTYFPTRDLSGNYGESLANTFAIPEGVSLYGGFKVNARAGKWYGRYVKPKDYGAFVQKPTQHSTWVYSTANVDTIPAAGHRLPTPPGSTASVQDLRGDSIILTYDGQTYTIVQASAINMAAFRSQIDVNKNNIIEPWEFENQTILSGNATSAADQGVYHIVTICPDETVVGILPTISGFRDDASYTAAGGYLPKEYGQYIQFNGLTFQGGRAHTYSAELDEMAKYNYYHGGAALIDGNRYNNNYNDSIEFKQAHPSDPYVHKATAYQHLGRTNAVAYRDIMTTIANCRFYDNEAGYGGAISTNAELELFNSAFESNLASNFSDHVPNADKSDTYNLTFAGQGGAVFTTYSLSAFNTLFANNEARDLNHTGLTSGTYYSYRNYKSGGSNELPGTGGAVYAGLHSSTHMFNCDVVRNMANSYPGVFTMNPNTYNGNPSVASAAAYNQFVNTVFWGNEVNATVKSANSGSGKLFAAQLAINYGAANRNIAASYDPFASGKYPTSQADLDDAANDDNLSAKKFSEMLYFCAYEEGRGITAKNSNDFRIVSPHFYVHPTYTFSHVDPDGGTNYLPYQNNNIAISGDNDALDGPAFMRPSYSAGIAGYLEAADWSPARLNNLTDNGSGKLMQTISDEVVDAVSKKVADFVQYANVSELPNRSIYAISPSNAFTTENVGDYVGDGAYTMARYLANYPYYKDYLAIGDERYMRTSTGEEMHRISLDPNPTHYQTYVDIGVYEYIHVELKPETEDEVDILWVSNFEKPENGKPNGSSWLQPTSDLQRAIETLLASRNGNRKEIRLCDGTYSPIYTIDGKLAFYIDTKFLNSSATLTDGRGVKSLVIKGGYSREYNNQYDVDLYPVIIKQQETATPSAKYDHLIYIQDATQRYGAASYTDANKYGWNLSAHDNKVNTIPIQIDGVTLINNQAQASTQGTAIYYASQQMDDHTASSTTPAKVTTSLASGSHTFATIANPAKLIISKTTVLGSGAKNEGMFKSVAVWIGPDGGNTMIYNSLFHSNTGDPLVAYNALTVNNTFALNAGQVRLENAVSAESSKDITSKIFNSVFWRNNNGGAQLILDGLRAKGADFVHDNTSAGIFAYNAYTGGNSTDIDYDPTTGTGIQGNNHNVGLVNLNTDVTYGPNFNDPENTDLLKRDFHISPSMRLLNKGNNTLYGDTTLASNNVVYDLSWDVTKQFDLATKNRIAAVTIDLGAYEYQYDLNRVIYVDPNKATSGDGLSWKDALGFGTIQNAIDLAGVAHSNLQKPTYVFVKAASSTNMDLHTGETLTLRDGVQIYGSVMADYGVECPYSKGVGGERTFRDSILDAYVGDVLLYGRYGVISPVEGHTRISGINTNGTAFTTTDGSRTVHKTLIDGFEVMPKNAAAATITRPVINITPYKSDDELATGNVQVGLRNIAVHGYTANGCNVAELDNAILYSTLFHHNTVSGDKAVMKVKQYGYLLNATIEGKTIGADDNVALHGGAVDEGGVAWANTAGEAASHIYCSLVNFNYPGYRHEPTIKTLSGYCYALEDENLNYQLTENSVNIDNYHSVVPAGIPTQLRGYASALTPTYTAAEATHITQLIAASYLRGEIGSSKLTVTEGKLRAADRDLLGNFRWQPGFKVNPACPTCNNNGLTYNIIDRGAFETWKIEKPYFVEYPNYPYPGTCEYIMKDQALMIDPVADDGDATAAAHIPGFVLLQEGASLYGNGREMEIAYAGIERTVKNGADLMLSLPWDQNMLYNGISDADRNAVNGVFVVEYDAAGALKTVRTDASPVYNYDPTARADWQYRMAPSESSCWKPITSPVLPACTGVYTNVTASNAAAVKGGNATAELTIRCMGKGTNMHDYIYEELVESGHIAHTGKAVKLYPHDDAASTDGGGDFTDAKNAGWNFIGYPYLISRYHPYTKAIVTAKDSVFAELNPGVNDQDRAIAGETYAEFLASSNPYAMDRPQTMWIWYDGVNGPDGNPVDGTGGFYSVNSWFKEPEAWHVANTVEPVLRVTEGFFVQTHTLQESEDLVFYRPTYRSHYGGPASAPVYSPYRYYVGDDNDNENDNEKPGIVGPEQVDNALIPYEKIFRNDHVYIVRRDADGRITESFDLTGRRVEL